MSRKPESNDARIAVALSAMYPNSMWLGAAGRHQRDSRRLDLATEVVMICEHELGLAPGAARTRGCEECMKTGSQWVHLRLCLSCGHVGCCDSSPGRHAKRH